MEALHQEYRDRVNFLYMYVREAHPNPAQAPCGSTSDLGWNHPSRDTVWVSDVTFANPHPVSVDIELTYLPRDRDNTQAPTLEFIVGPGQSMTLEDVVQGAFETHGSGALLVQAQRPLVVVSRIFNDTPDGTFGQFIAGFDDRGAIHAGQVGYIQINEALTEVGAADAANVRAEIEVLTDGGRVLAYASTVDNRTGDPVFQMAWTRE